MLFRLLPLVLLSLLSLPLGGCAYLQVSVMDPANVNLGVGTDLSVVQTTGRPTRRDFIIDELERQSRAFGYFTVTDRQDEGIEMKIVGRDVRIEGEAPEQHWAEIFVRLDLLEWAAYERGRIETYRDDNGNDRERRVDYLVGKVVFTVSASNASGRALMVEEEYVGERWQELRSNPRDDEVISEAAEVAIARLLYDITPRLRTESIRIDTSDKDQRPIIELLREGALLEAEEQFRSFLKSSPENNVAKYNLAVCLDAQRRYQEALGLYDKALETQAPAYYAKSRAACARRLMNSEAMNEQ